MVGRNEQRRPLSERKLERRSTPAMAAAPAAAANRAFSGSTDLTGSPPDLLPMKTGRRLESICVERNQPSLSNASSSSSPLSSRFYRALARANEEIARADRVNRSAPVDLTPIRISTNKPNKKG